MSYELGADGKYADLPLSNFPDSIDEFENKTAVNADNLAIANQYRGYLQNGNYGLAAQMREVYPELNRIIIDESTINKMQQTIQAVQRVFRDDVEKYVKNQAFEDDLMVWEYTHSYDPSAKIHNFTGRGTNGKAKITADYHSGDVFAVNGVNVTTHMGGSIVTKLFNGEYMYFFIHGSDMYFIGGGDTSGLMQKAGGTFEGRVNFANGSSYYVDGSGNANFNTITGNKVYGAVYNDYAEWFERGEETEPGDLIALDTDSEKERYVKADMRHNCVVGVHSDEYSHIIGGKKYDTDDEYFSENIKEYIPVGLAGRVSVKVIGKVKKGQYITVSDIPGVGKATDSREDGIGLVVNVDSGTGLRYARIKLK